MDSLLGQRSLQEHEATTAIKTEFMQLWEGFETAAHSNILVLGATNKRERLDDAVLRRFSLQYEVRRRYSNCGVVPTVEALMACCTSLSLRRPSDLLYTHTTHSGCPLPQHPHPPAALYRCR